MGSQFLSTSHAITKAVVLLTLAAASMKASVVYSFTTINVPGVNGTTAWGINNNGQIVGYYEQGPGPGFTPFGFLDTAGTFTTIVDPSSTSCTTHACTFPYGINNSGQIVGSYAVGAGNQAFFDTAGTFTDIPVPGTFNSLAGGINNSSQIVGYFFDANGQHGFLDIAGMFTTIDAPGRILFGGGSSETVANGINNSGQIVGYYAGTGGKLFGFLDIGGTFTTIDDPNAVNMTVTGTQANGINDSAQIVGSFTNASGHSDGFIYIAGTFTTLDVPGAINTYANGINDSGQIVGYFTDAGGTHAFLATPTPEPGTLPLSVGCLIGLVMASCRKFHRQVDSELKAGGEGDSEVR